MEYEPSADGRWPGHLAYHSEQNSAAARPYRFEFVMEQQVGHKTYFQNLRSVVEAHSDIIPAWIKVTYVQQGGFFERLPLLSRHAKGTLRGVLQVRRGLRRAGGPLDGLFFFTQNPAVFHRSLLRRIPTVISLDITAATTVGGTADIIVDGLNGLRIQPHQEALAQALEVFLSRPELCRTMGRAARVTAEERFDIITNGNRLLHAFRSVVDGHRQQAKCDL